MTDAAARPGRRSTKVGQVVSRSGSKTIVVEVTRRVQDPMYRRFVRRSKNFHVHDEQDQCHVGDWVRIAETRPLSRLKRWRLQEIIRRAVILAPTEPTGTTETPEAAPAEPAAS